MVDEYSLAGFGFALKAIDVSIAYAVSILIVIERMTESLLVWMDRTQPGYLFLHLLF